MQEIFEKIKERVCEFIHERNKSGSVPCKNQRASCLQLIRVCDLTRIVNQVAEEYKEECKWTEYIAPSKDLYYLTDCGHRHNGYLKDSRPYCGFCGKKINVVPYQPKGE